MDLTLNTSFKSADDIFISSKPKSKHAYWQQVGDQGQLFVVNGSRLFIVGLDLLAEFEHASIYGDPGVEKLLSNLGLSAPSFIDDTPIQSPPLHAISLAVAQKCNLGCTYCYADHGKFGGNAKNMSSKTAEQSVRLLMNGAQPGSKVNIAFLGGEPLANRLVLRSATEYAQKLAEEHNVQVTFSITTNGSLLTEEDAIFFEQYGFAVTVSLDGIGQQHDQQRPFKNGRGSFDNIMTRVKPLIDIQKKMQVSVRATITPQNLKLLETLDYFLKFGFHSVGFSPLLRSPNGQGEMEPHDLAKMLTAMVECGTEFERRVELGERYSFSNMVNALRELHRGTHRPYPCGAGAGYLGVSADGELAACHRFVGDIEGAMGNLTDGIDHHAQDRWLTERHVHKQSPCDECWARYLCSGGCHHEVIARGRPACDYIRGWLHYCLQAYARLMKEVPDYFSGESCEAI